MATGIPYLHRQGDRFSAYHRLSLSQPGTIPGFRTQIQRDFQTIRTPKKIIPAITYDQFAEPGSTHLETIPMTRSTAELVACIVCVVLAGCTSESPSNGPAEQSRDNGTQVIKWRDRYRFRNSQGREEFDISMMITDLKGSDSLRRIAAAKVIPFTPSVKFEPTLGPLIQMLEADDEREQQAAAEGISRHGHGGSRPDLLANAVLPLKRIMEGSGSEETRRWATIALAETGPRLSDDQQTLVIAVLTNAMRDPSYDIARHAIEGLGEFEGRAESAIPAIIEQLGAGEHRTLIAATALGRIRRRPDLCVPELLRAADKSPEWTEDILQSLGAFGSDAAPVVPLIQRSLKSRNGNTLIAAACALAEIGPAAESAADDLLRAFETRKDAPDVIQDEARIALLYAMCSVGPKGRDHAADILGKIHGLRLFNNTHMPIRPAIVLKMVENSPNVTTLLLSGSELNDEELKPVRSLSNLEVLAMPQSTTNESLQYVGGLSKLKELKQDLWSNGSSRDRILDDNSIAHLQNCIHLQSLTLRIRLSGAGVRRLAKCQELRSITVLEMNDEALQNLPDLPQLESLHINDGAISDAGVAQLNRFPTLRHLSLRSTDVTDAGMASLAQDHPELVSLNLAHDNVTAASVPSLSRLKKLKELIVYATPLAGSRDVLDMSMTPSVVQLRKALPGCEVIYAD